MAQVQPKFRTTSAGPRLKAGTLELSCARLFFVLRFERVRSLVVHHQCGVSSSLPNKKGEIINVKCYWFFILFHEECPVLSRGKKKKSDRITSSIGKKSLNQWFHRKTRRKREQRGCLNLIETVETHHYKPSFTI